MRLLAFQHFQPSAVILDSPFPWEREENVTVPPATSGNTETRESEVLVVQQDGFQESSLQIDASLPSSLEEEKPDPEQEVDGTSASQSGEETPGKVDEKDVKKAFMKNGDENFEDMSSSENDHVQADVTAARNGVRREDLVSKPPVESVVVEALSEDEMQFMQFVTKRWQRETYTSRVLVIYMDWDQFNAQDLVLFFNSFKLRRGVVQSAAIYTSLTKDYRTGCKMNYKLAVLTCDSVQTACRICIQCDSMACESTTGKLYFEFVSDNH